ncbi:MAG TPA: hypothetical protein VMU46_08350 [Burkholderiales bacterium]|nr:hypothetical protein [Burkholderiales bacterium]
MIRSSAIVAAGFVLASTGVAFAQTSWHGPSSGTPPPAPAPTPAKPAAVTVQGNSIHVQLGRAIALKYANPEFAAARSVRGRLPPDSYSVPEEQGVRRARDQIAFARRAPADAQVLTIPRGGAAPQLDGVVGEAEWRGALRLALEPAARKAAVFLIAHGGQLYLAAIAPGDKTEEGFDQFRFWYHLELSPFMDNERAMISGRGGAKTLRGTRLPRPGEPIRDGLDPRTLVQDADWGVSGRLRSASAVSGFRQYEAAVDLTDAGIAPGVAFPAFLEIEGDPEMDAGKFKARFIEGQIGSAGRPIWLRIAP